MIHDVTYLLFRFRLIQPSEKNILFWENTEDVSKLEVALKSGNYKTRLLAAESLEHVGKPSSIPVLLNAINDKIQSVSIAALNALEALGCKDELVVSITRKRFNWVKSIRDKAEKEKENKNKKHNIHRWERASKKSFELVKERLKRPIR